MMPVLLVFLFQATGSISGTVVDSLSGVPIRKAQVRITQYPTPVVTDASGSFLFDQVPSGSYALTATNPEYPPGRAPASVSLQLAPGERKNGLQVKLTPAAQLSGRIVDDDGDPLPNCSVTLFANTHLLAMILANVPSTRTGGYAFRTVPSGKYYLEAHCPTPALQPRPFAPPETPVSGPKFGYGRRFYPNARELSGAQKLVVTLGQKLNGLDFRMAPEPFSSLKLHVTGMAAPRLSATLSPDDGSPQRRNDTVTATLRRPGELRFEMLPIGRYILRIQSTNPERMLLSKQPVTVREEPGEMTVAIEPPVPLTGILRRGNTPDPQPTRISLDRSDEPGFHIQTELKPDGSFAFRGVATGHYRVGNLGDTWVQAVSIGGQMTEGPEFEFKPGASGPLEITTGSERGGVSGDIDIASSHPSRIVVIATFGFAEIQLANTTLRPPRYSDKLPPGQYRLYAVEVAEGGDIFGFLDHESLVSRGERVKISANGEAVSNLKLITADEIEKADQ